MKKFISALTLLCFILTSEIGNYSVYAQAISLPVPGVMVDLSPAYEPVLIKGLKIHPENPFLFDFILDLGDNHPVVGPKVPIPGVEEVRRETIKLIKYFLASLTVPEKDLWVNLSPYEKDRMIAPNLGQTEMGRDMLAQDYILKQLTASLIYPEKHLGKTFWDEVYTKARQMYGTTQVPVNTFNKVWIVADKADVFERGNVAYVVGAHLKVMLEEDYLALNKSSVKRPNCFVSRKVGVIARRPADFMHADEAISNRTSNNTHSIASQIIRRIILPQIEKEVNTGENFAPLRQMFYSMILSSWYKMALKDAILTQIYGNKSKVKVGVNQTDPKANEEIFQRYLRAYKKGVFNYIKDVINQTTDQTVPRKYFSGGENMAMLGGKDSIVHRMREWGGRILPDKYMLVSISLGLKLRNLVSPDRMAAFPSNNPILVNMALRQLSMIIASQPGNLIDRHHIQGLIHTVSTGYQSLLLPLLYEDAKNLVKETKHYFKVDDDITGDETLSLPTLPRFAIKIADSLMTFVSARDLLEDQRPDIIPWEHISESLPDDENTRRFFYQKFSIEINTNDGSLGMDGSALKMDELSLARQLDTAEGIAGLILEIQHHHGLSIEQANGMFRLAWNVADHYLLTTNSAAMTAQVRYSNELRIDDPGVVQSWEGEVQYHLKLYEIMDKLVDLTNQYGYFNHFPPEDLKGMWDQLKSIGWGKPKTPLSKKQKYVYGFLTLNAGNFVGGLRSPLELRTNLLLLTSLIKSGIPFDDIRSIVSNETHDRFIEDLHFLSEFENTSPLVLHFSHFNLLRAGDLRDALSSLFMIQTVKRVSFNEIAADFNGSDKPIITLLPEFKGRFSSAFFQDPGKYIRSKRIITRFPEFLEKDVEDFNFRSAPPALPGASIRKTRKWVLADGMEIYSKRVDILRTRSPQEEITLANRVNEELQRINPKLHAQHFIGIVYDKGLFYLLSEGVKEVNGKKISGRDLEDVERVLKENKVAEPEGFDRAREILIQEGGHYTIVDFETLPHAKSFAMTANSNPLEMELALNELSSIIDLQEENAQTQGYKRRIQGQITAFREDYSTTPIYVLENQIEELAGTSMHLFYQNDPYLSRKVFSPKQILASVIIKALGQIIMVKHIFEEEPKGNIPALPIVKGIDRHDRWLPKTTFSYKISQNNFLRILEIPQFNRPTHLNKGLEGPDLDMAEEFYEAGEVAEAISKFVHGKSEPIDAMRKRNILRVSSMLRLVAREYNLVNPILGDQVHGSDAMVTSIFEGSGLPWDMVLDTLKSLQNKLVKPLERFRNGLVVAEEADIQYPLVMQEMLERCKVLNAFAYNYIDGKWIIFYPHQTLELEALDQIWEARVSQEERIVSDRLRSEHGILDESTAMTAPVPITPEMLKPGIGQIDHLKIRDNNEFLIENRVIDLSGTINIILQKRLKLGVRSDQKVTFYIQGLKEEEKKDLETIFKHRNVDIRINSAMTANRNPQLVEDALKGLTDILTHQKGDRSIREGIEFLIDHFQENYSTASPQALNEVLKSLRNAYFYYFSHDSRNSSIKDFSPNLKLANVIITALGQIIHVRDILIIRPLQEVPIADIGRHDGQLDLAGRPVTSFTYQPGNNDEFYGFNIPIFNPLSDLYSGIKAAELDSAKRYYEVGEVADAITHYGDRHSDNLNYVVMWQVAHWFKLTDEIPKDIEVKVQAGPSDTVIDATASIEEALWRLESIIGKVQGGRLEERRNIVALIEKFKMVYQLPEYPPKDFEVDFGDKGNLMRNTEGFYRSVPLRNLSWRVLSEKKLAELIVNTLGEIIKVRHFLQVYPALSVSENEVKRDEDQVNEGRPVTTFNYRLKGKGEILYGFQIAKFNRGSEQIKGIDVSDLKLAQELYEAGEISRTIYADQVVRKKIVLHSAKDKEWQNKLIGVMWRSAHMNRFLNFTVNEPENTISIFEHSGFSWPDVARTLDVMIKRLREVDLRKSPEYYRYEQGLLMAESDDNVDLDVLRFLARQYRSLCVLYQGEWIMFHQLDGTNRDLTQLKESLEESLPKERSWAKRSARTHPEKSRTIGAAQIRVHSAAMTVRDERMNGRESVSIDQVTFFGNGRVTFNGQSPSISIQKIDRVLGYKGLFVISNGEGHVQFLFRSENGLITLKQEDIGTFMKKGSLNRWAGNSRILLPRHRNDSKNRVLFNGFLERGPYDFSGGMWLRLGDDQTWRSHININLDKLSEFMVNRAMASEHLTPQTVLRGGIDLSRSRIKVSKEGQGVQMRFDPAMVARIKREGFDGLDFQIEKIIPVTDLPLLLGLNKQDYLTSV